MYLQYLFLLLLSFNSQLCHGYFVTVDAHAEECFFDKVEMGTKLGKYSDIKFLQVFWKPVLIICLNIGLTFEISEGGFLDIDVKIVGPDNRIIYQGDRETSGKYTFAAHMPGMYTYCFSNKMSTMTPKVVMFNMEVGEPAVAEKQEGEKLFRVYSFASYVL